MTVVELRPGARLGCPGCTTSVIVIRAHTTGAATLACGGLTMGTAAGDETAGAPTHSSGQGALLGKRYVDADATIELLCTKAGDGPLTLDGRPLDTKAAKALPSSD